MRARAVQAVRLYKPFNSVRLANVRSVVALLHGRESWADARELLRRCGGVPGSHRLRIATRLFVRYPLLYVLYPLAFVRAYCCACATP